MRKQIVLNIILLLFIVFASCARITTQVDSKKVDFAIDEIEKALSEKELKIELNFAIDSSLSCQSYHIISKDNAIQIFGGDDLGLMYGGLELMEMINIGESLENLNIKQSPDILNRGLKLNIPLDARCPSYDDTGDAAQKNIAHIWELDFWAEYFDLMAKYRYNVLSLWSPNPFQVMTKLPNYPDLALDDVYVTNAVPVAEREIWDDAGGVNNTVTDDMRLIKKISIDEKITFWQNVFQMAQDRGIDVYLYTWNIYLNGAEDNAYGLTEEIDNPLTKAYYREATKVFLETYPQIKGIGVTAGERMEVEEGHDVADERERWLWESYGLGILDYKKENPEREIPFVHRVWYSSFSTIMKYWGNYPDAFDVGYKYVKARLYSSPKESPFITGLKDGLKEEGLKCWWNLRNDDIFVYRWGDPYYVREFLGNLPKDYTAGFHWGADGYVYGKVFADKAPEIQGSSELEKHWYEFMLWGRLAYDNEYSDTRIMQLLEWRYPGLSGFELYDTWRAASQVIPQINRMAFHTGDRHWAPEMCSSRESFKFTPYFRIARPMKGVDEISPYDYYKNESKKGITPYQVVEHLRKNVLNIERNLVGVQGEGLEYVKADIKAMGYLGDYYLNKIMAAALLEDLATYGEHKNKEKLLQRSMRNATRAWKEYATLSDSLYHTQMYARVDSMDWFSLLKSVEKDEELIKYRKTKYSLKTLLSKQNPILNVFYPYKGDRRWVEVSGIGQGDVKLYVFDARKELVNYYENYYSLRHPYLVWEDLWWLPKGEYTIVLEVNEETCANTFNVK